MFFASVHEISDDLMKPYEQHQTSILSPLSSFGSVKDTTEIHNDFVVAFFSVTSKRAKGEIIIVYLL